MTPATPETYVVEVNARSSLGYTLTPILGWIEEEKRPLPVTLHGKHRLVDGTAVMFPGGMVHNPSDVLAFDSVEAWLESNPTAPKRHASTATVKVTTAPAVSAEPGSAYDIEWIDKPFKSNSFWHYDDGTHTFVFMVEGGNDIPKATTKVAKIKRDDYMALKKEIDVMTVEDILNADPLPMAEDEDEQEDDDGDDLI